MKRLLSFVVVILSSSLLISTVFAQSGLGGVGAYGPCGGYAPSMGYGMGMGQGYARGANPDAGYNFMPRFMAVDVNEDGVVSPEEAAQNVEFVFRKMDTDEDESLTPEEYISVRMGPGYHLNPDRQQAMQMLKKSRFEAKDTDKNGVVSQQEFLNAGKIQFKASDADKNGTVDPWEFRSTRYR